MSEIQSENIKPESSVVNPTALSKARTSKNNKPAQATHSSDELRLKSDLEKQKRYQNQLNGSSLKCLTYNHK